MPKTISLIGYRGAGKTTVAQQLALALGWDWVDTDVEIELHAGKSIAAIFADDGEQAFRDLESAVLAELIGRERAVLALGGGVVLRPENRALLAQAGCTIWLQADPVTISARMRGDSTTAARRPALTSLDGFSEIQRLLDERAPLYESCAAWAIDTVGKTPGQIAQEIYTRLSRAQEMA